MEPMMNSRHDARVKILALEKIRVVETNLIQLSYPLIRRLEMDLEQHHGQPLAADLREHLFKGGIVVAAGTSGCSSQRSEDLSHRT